MQCSSLSMSQYVSNFGGADLIFILSYSFLNVVSAIVSIPGILIIYVVLFFVYKILDRLLFKKWRSEDDKRYIYEQKFDSKKDHRILVFATLFYVFLLIVPNGIFIFLLIIFTPINNSILIAVICIPFNLLYTFLIDNFVIRKIYYNRIPRDTTEI